MSIRVLIVDDSALMRKLLEARLVRERDIEVVGAACDAAEARAMIKALDPDVVTLDIEMPGMDGLSFLEKIIELRPMPVIIVSGSTQEGAQITTRALQIGAVSCYAKSNRYGELLDDDGGKLASLVREAVKVDVSAKRQKFASRATAIVQHDPSSCVVAIGASTGGVEALHTLLGKFPANCPPTVIVQHVNACFAPAIAQSLDAVCDARVMLAQSDIVLEKGQILLAPGGDRHMLVASAGSKGYRSILRPGKPISGHQPSVDVLFESVAKTCGSSATGILLTGMGQDGAHGLLKLSQAGAQTIAQDESSSVVFGMPRAAIELGAAQKTLPLDKIASDVFGGMERAA